MGTTSANMLLSLPTLQGDPGTYDDQLNASLARIDLHNHTTGLGVQVPTAGIGINAALTFAGYAGINMGAVSFATAAAYTVNRSLWVSSATDELMWRNASGTSFAVTSGGGLNMSLVGGITGDYSGAGAALYYDDSAQAYRFLEAAPAPNNWSYVKAGGFDLYEHASGIANFIGLRSPAALAASYNLTFPAALPGSTLLQQVSSAGVISWSNTISGAVTMSSTATVGSTLGVTGLITATAGLTAAANQHVTISGTGELKHGDRVRTYNAMGIVVSSNLTPGGISMTSTGAAVGFLMLPFNVGERIKSVTIALFGDGAADVTIDVKTVTTAGALASIGASTVNNQPASWSDTTINVTDTTVTDSLALHIRFDVTATGLSIGNVRVTYDRP